MKTFRKAVVEISLAFLIAGCILFFPDKASVRNSSPAPVNALATLEKTQLPRHKSMNPQQNCSAGNITITVSNYNVTTNTTTFSTISNGAACAPLPADSLATTTSQSVVYPFTSGTVYQITLNIDCSIGANGVLKILAAIFRIDPSRITIQSFTCGSATVVFTCGSATSAQDAQATCAAIANAACDPSTALGQRLKGVSCGTFGGSSSSSSTALYALFALVALPILILGCLILWYRTRQREADNQYMQDTATFSNVAASPQALGQQYYPPPSTFSHAPAGYAPAPTEPYVKPY